MAFPRVIIHANAHEMQHAARVAAQALWERNRKPGDIMGYDCGGGRFAVRWNAKSISVYSQQAEAPRGLVA